MAKLPRIDWKKKLGHLKPFLDGTSGGVVCIQGGASSGWVSFLKIIRELLHEIDSNLPILVFNPEDETTRAPETIVQALEAELSLHPDTPGIHAEITQEIKSKGDVHTGATYIEVGQPDPSFRLHPRTANIKTTLEQRDLPRLVIIMEGCQGFPPATMSWLWSSLWGRNLSKLPPGKILLLCVCEAASGTCNWDPKRAQPEIQINLPHEYSGDELEEAVQDLMEYSQEPKLNADGARGFLLGCKNQPTQVYSSLSWQRLQPK